MKKILLTQGQFALVDNADYEWLNQWKWQAFKVENTFYGYRCLYRKNGSQKNILMHRQILGLIYGDGKDTDHIDGNGLNNSRSNLRVCTRQQNSLNRKADKYSSSRFKGVHFDRERKKWQVQIQYGRKHIHLGRFADEIEAAAIYDKMAKHLFGDYARLNFPTGLQEGVGREIAEIST